LQARRVHHNKQADTTLFVVRASRLQGVKMGVDSMQERFHTPIGDPRL